MTEPRQGTDHAALLKRSLVAIDQLKAQLAAAEQARSEPIAIIGMGCRFPGQADTPEAFWSLLHSGRDAVTEVPPHRWDVERYYDPNPDAMGKSYTRWGSFVEGVDRFDAPFFGISPREAVSLDPQQRLLLEVSWEALERAGLAPSSLAGSRTAVYMGITTSDYAGLMNEERGPCHGDAYTPSGTAHSVAAGRLSYFFGLHGPNVAVDTACSSSLVAIHWAIQSLRNGEAELALAGGVNLTLAPNGAVLTSRARMMSFDGHCKTFDASADGYVRGEGCGVLVLKRLSDAQRDGDRVLAVLRGSALNQDGRSSGLTAPNGAAQEAVIRAALANARLQPGDIGYVEAHGTGTPLGDPIEMKALNQVFGERPRERPLMVGSVKTNIGHLEASAGVAGVMKVVLALQHATVPPHLHLRQPNPLIAWDQYPITVPTAPTAWPRPGDAPRRACVSSFGFSGTNAHVVLEEAPPPPAAPATGEAPRAEHLVVLSAHTATALAAQARRLDEALAAGPALPLAPVAATLALGRSHFVERLALVAASTDELRAQLKAFLDSVAAPDGESVAPAGVVRARAALGAAPEVVFMFTGQGAQYAGMGRQLYEQEPVFRAALDECDRLVSPLLPHGLLDTVFASGEDAARLDDTAFTQPALFAIEYALAQLWRSWGVVPTAVMGHSVGEYVAACLAGVFSLADGLRLIAARGRLMGQLPRDGGMAAVFADEATVRQAIAADAAVLSIAAVNGPGNTVISGRSDALAAALARLRAQGVESQPLVVSHAFHSPLMEPMLEAFRAELATVRLNPPSMDLASNLTGTLAGEEVCTPEYWCQHVRDAVRFGDGIAALQKEGYRVFVEVGPAPTLVNMAQRASALADASFIASLRKGRADTRCLLESLGRLHARGLPVQWRAVLGEAAARQRVVLPTYAFQRERYWFEPGGRAEGAALAPTRSGHPLLGGVVPSPLSIFQSHIGVASQPWLADHRIFEFTLFPGTGFLELAQIAGREVAGTDDGQLFDVLIREGLPLPEEGQRTVQVVVDEPDQGRYAVRVFSRADAEAPGADAPAWKLHVGANFVVGRGSAAPAPLRRAGLLGAAAREHDVQAYYARLAEQGAHYGPAFRCITEIRSEGRQVLGRVALPAGVAAAAPSFVLHPALLDACLQLVGVGLSWGDTAPDGTPSDDLCVPVGMGNYRVHQTGLSQAWCHVSVDEATPDAEAVGADVTLFDDHGVVVAEVRRLVLKRVTRALLQRAMAGNAPATEWAFEADWQALPPTPAPDADAEGRWLVLADASGVGQALAARLRRDGAGVAVIARGEGTAECGADGWRVDPSDAAQVRRAIEAAARADARALKGIVVAWTLTPPAGGADLQDAHLALLGDLLRVVQSLGESHARLYWLTRGAQAVAGSVPDLLQAPLWGLGGVVASEYPALRCVRVDLDPTHRDDETELLWASLRVADAEDRVALRGGLRHVSRLVPGDFVPEPRPLRLEITERGSLDRLALLPVPREAPGPGEVEIRVHATGLNFRDVLNALGMYPGDPGPLGNECAGVVCAVGEGVTDLAVGDEVVAMVDKSFATWVIAPAVMTVKKPPSLTFAEAATIPVTFLTAEYALRHLAGMKKGDRVLVHAVTGGVGMAALQLARRAGAEVFGTAGSPAKRALATELGTHHLADSRSLSFVPDVRRDSKGEGVDIVLNSLAGDFIPASLGLLRPGGHFIEIGKTGIWDAAKVGAEFPGVHYHPLYLGEVAAERPEFVRDMLRDLLADFETGVLKPLPQRLYPIEAAEDAFRFMGQGHHVGKIVITQHHAPAVRADASYLVTGGLTGLGLVTARWLAREGARHLVLMGRRAPSAEAQAAIAELEAAGVRVRVAQGDVADAAQVSAVVDGLGRDMPRLRGVVHAAGLVDDGTLAELGPERFEAVLSPKVRGAWNLHQATARLALDFFVCFSSGAALMGSPGQGNYAAANTFMDALAHLRRSQGRHALSINWGSWAEVGMAAGLGELHHRRWAAMGLGMITPDEGMRMLGQMLRGARAPQMAAMPLVRARLPANLGPFFSALVDAAPTKAAAPAAEAVDILPRLSETPAPERHAVLSDFLADQVVRVLALGAAHHVDPQRSLIDLGMDSLMAMELRNRIQASLKATVAVADLLQGPSVSSLASSLLDGLDLPSGEAALEAGTVEGVEWEEGTL
ncbi:type I polyketide synthase [Hydrogenophaga sp. YM1]|uniref:type I polyketide synthase n=2 Tax=unclassified Hydrogenophaga TaxID=2610897 RepID=UPI00195E1F5C|nr:type I polyketide synthase [Hydrogenophaga sp. YM1]QRR36015.1 type I polyketide synthase [Hydrogenophaga sp. YM1]